MLPIAMPVTEEAEQPGQPPVTFPPALTFAPQAVNPAATSIRAAAASPSNSPQTPATPVPGPSAADFAVMTPEPQPPMPVKSGLARLSEAAERVRNPFARFLAKTGTGILRAADFGAEALAPRLAIDIPGSTLGTSIRNAANVRNWQKNRALDIEAGRTGIPLETEAMRERAALNLQGVRGRQASALETQRETGQENLENQRQAGREILQDEKSVTQRYTNPFEAFAYGSPQEKQSAEDFLRFEKQTGAQYQKPDEVEERYQLYKRDPEAYKAMFGNRGGAQDQAQAARMLSYFTRRRQQIQNDWTLTPEQQEQQLAEIDQLEQPYLSAAETAPSGKAGAADRVTVIAPDGRRGTIPRSQLKAATKRGYKLAK